LSICFFIALSWLFVGVGQGKMKSLLLRYIYSCLETLENNAVVSEADIDALPDKTAKVLDLIEEETP
jgi:hypothetical protein